MARKTRPVLVVASAATLVLGVGACSAQSTTGQGTASSTVSGSSGSVSTVTAGTLTACTHLAYKPFEYSDNGKVVGFDIDIVDAVAKKLGYKTQTVDIEWSSIVSGAVYASKRCDISVGGATITDERKKAVAFSDPYFDATQVLLVKSTSSIKGLSDLKGKKLGVQTDTTGQIYGQKNMAANGYSMVVFDDSVSDMNSVKSGRADAAINDNGVVFDYVKSNPDTKVAAQFDTGEQYGVMMAKNNTAMQTLVNQTIKEMKADGSYATSYKKWFGTDPSSK